MSEIGKAEEKQQSPTPSFFKGNNLYIPLIMLSLVLAFAAGTLWQRVKVLENKGTNLGTENPNNQPTIVSDRDIEPITDNDHIKGNPDARFALIEYSDLECPFCKSFHPIAQQLVDGDGENIMWVYRHFPLDQIHSKADKEAEAVECANELAGNEGFWALLDKIYEVTPSNNGLNLDDLPELAGEVGINETSFIACLDSGKYAQHVEDDYQSGIKADVRGTPGNILLDTETGNSILFPGVVPLEQIKQAVESLKSA